MPSLRKHVNILKEKEEKCYDQDINEFIKNIFLKATKLKQNLSQPSKNSL